MKQSDLRDRAKKLGLYGILAHFDEFASELWLPHLLELEEEERGKRSLERRIRSARIGRFKAFADFDWKSPTMIDRSLIEELFTFEFLSEAANVAILGPNGVGKTMLAKNLAYQAVLRGHAALFVTASEMLNDLAARDTAGISRRLKRYTRPAVLVID